MNDERQRVFRDAHQDIETARGIPDTPPHPAGSLARRVRGLRRVWGCNESLLDDSSDYS